MRLQFVEAGEIVNVHGLKGEIKVLPWVDSPEDLVDFERCRIARKDYEIELCRVQKTCALMKLKGIDTVEDAQKLRGKTVLLFREDIDDEVIFAAELINMDVFCNDEKIGIITEVLDYPGNSVYVVKGEKSYMIPAVKAFILNTDMEGNRMDVTLLEGMETDAD
ncbi:MAG: 16S rRNA processing protein RimM [Oscillospiraceae bacterium]|nr:16S rRNA processing protein RimM [Oscillospiraceae bacterium]MBR6594964.1 16S rRNA processing protein RimM [Oscillospiraceae bacterium]